MQVGELQVKIGLDMGDLQAKLAETKTKLAEVGTNIQMLTDNIDRQMRVVQSGFEALAAHISNFGKGTDGLKNKLAELNQLFDLQKQKVTALKDAYAQTAAAEGKDSIAAKELAIEVSKAQTEYEKLYGQIKKTTSELERQSSTWHQAAQKMQDVGGKMKDAGEKVSKTGEKFSVGVSLPLIGIGAAATKMAMDSIESENLFEVSMGSMAGAARKWSEQISKSLGLNAFEVRKNVATFNVMFESMGMGTKASYGMATSLTKLAYDMASFYNLKPEEAFEKLRAGISGETEPLKELGINIQDTQIQTYALTHGIIKQGETMTEQQKIQARYGLIMQSTSKAQGDLARTADSPTNKLRIMTQQALQLEIQFGRMLIHGFQKAISVLTPLIQHFNSLSEGQKKTVITMAAMAAGIGPVLVGFGKMVTAVGEISKAGGKIISFVKSGQLAASATKVWTAAQWLLNAALNANPIGLVIIAVAALAVGVFLIIKNWDKIGSFFTNIWKKIKEAFSNGVENVKKFPAKFGPDILAVLTGPLGMLVLFIAKHWDKIKDGAAKAWNGIKKNIGKAWDGIKESASEKWDKIKNGVVGAFQWMYNHNYYFKDLVDFTKKSWEAIKEHTTKIWGDIKEKAVAKWGEIKDHLSATWDSVETKAGEVWGGIKGKVSDTWNTINSVTGTVWDGIKGNLSSKWSDIKSNLNAAFSPMVNTLSGVWGNIKSQAGSAWGNIRSTLSGAWDNIKSGFGNLAHEAWDWGKNLLHQFIEGIKSKFAELEKAVKNAAGTLAKNLGFHSPAEEGPGADADTWAPNLVKMFARGIEDTLPELQSSLTKFSITLQPAMAGGMGGYTPVSRIVRENTTNPGVDQLIDYKQLGKAVADALTSADIRANLTLGNRELTAINRAMQPIRTNEAKRRGGQV